MQTYRTTLPRALAAAHRFAAATGPVTLPIIVVQVALEVLS